MVPGNHEASNAVGFYKPMTPPIDKTPMVEIYNRMMRPAAPKDDGDVRLLHAIGSSSPATSAACTSCSSRSGPIRRRALWMDNDLEPSVSESTPVIIFTHDQPDVEAKHFMNPNGAHDINAARSSSRTCSPITSRTARPSTTPSLIEQAPARAFLERASEHHRVLPRQLELERVLRLERPDRTIVLHTFRVDSPMKGAVSATTRQSCRFTS